MHDSKELDIKAPHSYKVYSLYIFKSFIILIVPRISKSNKSPKVMHYSDFTIWLKDNSGTKRTFGLITHWYLVNRSLRFDFMIIECKEFYL